MPTVRAVEKEEFDFNHLYHLLEAVKGDSETAEALSRGLGRSCLQLKTTTSGAWRPQGKALGLTLKRF